MSVLITCLLVNVCVFVCYFLNFFVRYYLSHVLPGTRGFQSIAHITKIVVSVGVVGVKRRVDPGKPDPGVT